MALVETRSIDYVPLAERHGKVRHLWPIWFTGDAHMATLATGAISVAAGLSLFWSALAVIGGCIIGTILMAFHCTQGPHLGLPQMIQSRPQFGYLGALLVWIVALFTYIGFNALNQTLAADTLKELADFPHGPTVILFSIVSVAVAVIGYDLFHKAQQVSLGIFQRDGLHGRLRDSYASSMWALYQAHIARATRRICGRALSVGVFLMLVLPIGSLSR